VDISESVILLAVTLFVELRNALHEHERLEASISSRPLQRLRPPEQALDRRAITLAVNKVIPCDAAARAARCAG